MCLKYGFSGVGKTSAEAFMLYAEIRNTKDTPKIPPKIPPKIRPFFTAMNHVGSAFYLIVPCFTLCELYQAASFLFFSSCRIASMHLA